MTDAEVVERVCALAGKMCPAGRREATPEDALFTDLGYDSLSIFELSVAIESEFDTGPVGHTEIFDLVTVKDVADFVSSMRAAEA